MEGVKQEGPTARQRELARWILNHMRTTAGSKQLLEVELPKLSIPALEELRNAVRQLEEGASNADRKLRQHGLR